VTGAPIQGMFELPPRVETVTLPTLARDAQGRHHARRLALDTGDIGRLRAGIARAAAIDFEPDCVVVDRWPLGPDAELQPALEAVKASGCKLVLGLRDIEDDPFAVRRNWGPSWSEAIRRYYDLVLVYGPALPALDALDCLGWDDGSSTVPVEHVGYVGTRVPQLGAEDTPREYVLATVGGGSDGYDVLAAFLEALRLEPLGVPSLIVTGPLMPADHVERLEKLTAGLDATLWRFRPDVERLIVGARAVVAMAGYNTVSEVMRAGKPALLVPRVRPIQEQLFRARELARQGLQDVLHPANLSAETMRAALDRLLARPRPAFSKRDFCGTERTVELLSSLVGGGVRAGLRGSENGLATWSACG
jgi:predicted glycosyltransferase